MLKTVASVAFIFCASQANGQSCPDFFRFVDFGLEGRDGVIYRGGPTFRAESLTGQSLLVPGRTSCLDVSEIAKDGHGNPIPVVTSINYRPAKLNTALSDLRVAVVKDTKLAANENASVHLSRVDGSSAKITRGSNFLCASLTEPRVMSCQLKTPFSEDEALVVYCDAVSCAMPVLAIDATLFVSAEWVSEGSFLSDPDEAGEEISNKIQKIHDFLSPLSSKL